MSADRELKIKITADTASAVSGIDSVKAAQDRLNKSLATSAPDLDAMIKSEEDLAAKSRSLAAEKTALSEAAKTASKSMRGMGTVISQLSRSIGGLPYLGRVFMNPFALALITVVDLFNKAKTAIAEWNKELDAAIQKNADPMFATGIEAKRNALDEAANSFTSFIDKIERANDAERDFVESLKAADAASKDAFRSFNEINDAAFGLDEARLKQQLDKGIIDWDLYQAKLIELEVRHNNEKQKLHEQEQADEIKRTQQAVATSRGAEGPALFEATAAASAAGRATAQRDQDKDDLKAAQERQKELDAAVKKEEDRLNNEFGGGPFSKTRGVEWLKEQIANNRFGGKSPYDGFLDDFNNALATSQKNADLTKMLRVKLPGEETSAITTGAASSRAESAAERQIEATQRLTEKLNELTQASFRDDSAKVTQLKNLTAASKSDDLFDYITASSTTTDEMSRKLAEAFRKIDQAYNRIKNQTINPQ